MLFKIKNQGPLVSQVLMYVSLGLMLSFIPPLLWSLISFWHPLVPFEPTELYIIAVPGLLLIPFLLFRANKTGPAYAFGIFIAIFALRGLMQYELFSQFSVIFYVSLFLNVLAVCWGLSTRTNLIRFNDTLWILLVICAFILQGINGLKFNHQVIFFESSLCEEIFKWLEILIFAAFLAVDIQRLKLRKHHYLTSNFALVGALVLCLDFFGSYLRLLDPLGWKRYKEPQEFGEA